MNRFLLPFLFLLFVTQTLQSQVPDTGVYCYYWHITPSYKPVVNAIKNMPKNIHYTPQSLDFKVVRNPLFAELGVTYIVVAKNKEFVKVLFLTDSLAMRKQFQERIKTDSVFPSTLLQLYRNKKQSKWLKDESSTDYNYSIFDNNIETAFRFWQEDKNVTDFFSISHLKADMTQLLEPKDTLDYTTNQLSSTQFKYDVRYHYDEFKRHTDNYRHKFIDILPNTYKRSIPIYESEKTDASIIGYWDIDKYACVEKIIAPKLKKVIIYHTEIIEEKHSINTIKYHNLTSIQGYIKIE